MYINTQMKHTTVRCSRSDTYSNTHLWTHICKRTHGIHTVWCSRPDTVRRLPWRCYGTRGMSHVSSVNAASMSPTCIRLVIHVNTSCHTCECIMSYTWRSHVTFTVCVFHEARLLCVSVCVCVVSHLPSVCFMRLQVNIPCVPYMQHTHSSTHMAASQYSMCSIRKQVMWYGICVFETHAYPLGAPSGFTCEAR